MVPERPAGRHTQNLVAINYGVGRIAGSQVHVRGCQGERQCHVLVGLQGGIYSDWRVIDSRNAGRQINRIAAAAIAGRAARF